MIRTPRPDGPDDDLIRPWLQDADQLGAMANHLSHRPPEVEARLYRDHPGEFVAWACDGSKVQAVAATMEELHRRLAAISLSLNDVVIDFIDPGETAPEG